MTRPPVTCEEMLASRPIPSCWAATFMISPSWWLNQEDGWFADDTELPSWGDVEVLLLEGMEP